MPTPIDNSQLTALVSDLETKEQALADAKDADASAQATLATATSAAQSTAATVATQKSALDASVDALVAYVNGLK